MLYFIYSYYNRIINALLNGKEGGWKCVNGDYRPQNCKYTIHKIDSIPPTVRRFLRNSLIHSFKMLVRTHGVSTTCKFYGLYTRKKEEKKKTPATMLSFISIELYLILTLRYYYYSIEWQRRLLYHKFRFEKPERKKRDHFKCFLKQLITWEALWNACSYIWSVTLLLLCFFVSHLLVISIFFSL